MWIYALAYTTFIVFFYVACSAYSITVFKNVDGKNECNHVYCIYIENLSVKNSYFSKTAKIILDTVLTIWPKDNSSDSGETCEFVTTHICDAMLEKLPNDYTDFDVKQHLQKLDALQPMNIFLKHEIDKMQCVIKIVPLMLQDLKLAITGTVIMRENLRDALDGMHNARIPKVWSKEVIEAHKGWALDTAIIHNKVTHNMKDDITQPPTKCVYVYGLFLEGAGWGKHGAKLVESKPKVLFELMPVTHIYAIHSMGGTDKRMYQCLIYKMPCKTDLTFIAEVVLKMKVPLDHWVLRGVALLCDTKWRIL